MDNSINPEQDNATIYSSDNQTHPLPSTYQSSPIDNKKIKETSLILLIAAFFVTPLIAGIIWMILMKQYSIRFRVLLFIISCLAGGIIVTLGVLEGAAGGGIGFLGLIPVGLLLFLCPYIYSHKWPYGRYRNK